jgi:hypothetical protein
VQLAFWKPHSYNPFPPSILFFLWLTGGRKSGKVRRDAGGNFSARYDAAGTVPEEACR